MPVRNIPIGNQALTGQHARSGARYESGLERDFFELMTHDPLFDCVDWQPVTIRYPVETGRFRYTPDALVKFKIDATTGRRRRHMLVEVKYRDKLKENLAEFIDRFRAARAYARERGWIFRIYTERKIRSVAFNNRHFLSGFKDREPAKRYAESIIAALRNEPLSVNELIEQTTVGLQQRIEIIPAIWWLVAHGKVSADMDSPLTMISLLSLPE